MRDTTLSTHNVSVVYGKGAASALALENASVTFPPGEITMLMGASGSGKTTLLSVLGCLRRPEKGYVTFLGRNLERVRESELVALRRQHVGFVFQFFRLFRALSALENVRIGAQLSDGTRVPRGAAEDALASVGLSAKGHLLPEEMSGGERQRVAIARALVKQPQILLADEPTAALDSTSGRQVAELIHSSVKARGIIAVVATHDSRLAPIADRVVQIRDGKIIDDQRSVP